MLKINPKLINENLITGGNAIKTNERVDNKEVYKKRIEFGYLPNNSEKSVATNIDLSKNKIYKIEGYCQSVSNNVGFPLPFANPKNLGMSIMINITNDAQINVTTGYDRSGYKAWFDVYFYQK